MDPDAGYLYDVSRRQAVSAVPSGDSGKLLHYYESRVNEDGLLGDTGYWQFFDWVKEWENGSPVRTGEINILYNLLYVYALRTAAGIYRFCMRPDTALEYEARAESVAAAVRRSAYDTETGLFAMLRADVLRASMHKFLRFWPPPCRRRKNGR